MYETWVANAEAVSAEKQQLNLRGHLGEQERKHYADEDRSDTNQEC